MVKVRTDDPDFREAYLRSQWGLPVQWMESPRQYLQRWQETYGCRVDPEQPGNLLFTRYIFDRDEDYTWFMLRWS